MKGEPIHHGYYGYYDGFYYGAYWSQSAHSHAIDVRDSNLVDEDGNLLMSIGESGLSPGESDVLDPEAPVEFPSEDVDVAVGGATDWTESFGDGGSFDWGDFDFD